MQNNPNQEIHTDYRANDIFKPINANRLAESIHYDFVITQEMWDKYIENYPDEREIDVGVLVCCNSDGTKSEGMYSQLAKAPVSVYIAAKIPIAYTLNFTGAFANVVVDCSDFKSNGAWSATLTRDMIDIYSAHPYAVTAIAGGFNFWSNPVAYVQLNGNNLWDGICKIGSYKLTRSINLLRPSGFQLVIEGHNVGTYEFTYNFNDDSPDDYAGEARPSVVYANWMTGGGISTQYSISGQDMSSPTTIKNGLFAQMRASMTEYGTEPVLVVGHNYASARYTFCGWNSYYIRFANTDEGKTVDVYKEGKVVWKTATGGGSGTGSVDKVVLTDFDVTDLPYNSALRAVTEYFKNQRSVYRTNTKQFTDVCKDVADPDYVQWYSTSVGPSNEMNLFKFKGATVVDWYKWHAISSQNSATVATDVQWYYNTRDLLIDTESLVEGIVYEVNVHIMYLPSPTYTSNYGSGDKTCMQQAAPSDSPTDPPNFNHNVKPKIQFWQAEAKTTHNDVRYWGGTATVQNTAYEIIPSISSKVAVASSIYPGTQSGTSTYQLKEIASGSVQFVKLNGAIYVMKY